MDIRKEEDVSLNSPISPQEYSNTDAHHSFCASNPVDEDGKGDCDSRSPCEFNEPAILRPPPAPSLPNNGKEPVPNSTSLDEENRRIQDAIHTSAAAFVEGGIQDACDDSCSICLEPFCESDPAMVTSCKHNYHLQCILEWAQRSKECPMCWRLLSFEDPSSQELFDAVEQERFLTWGRHSTDGYHPHQVSTFATYADFFEERIMQHLAHQLARRGTLQNRGFSMNDGSSGVPPNQVLLRPNRAFLEQSMHAGRHADNNSSHVVVHGHSMNEQATNGSGRHNVASETTDDSQQRQDLSSLSESLKSRFLVASSKWKETFSKTTHSFRERWRARNNSSPTTDAQAQTQGLSADIVRQAIRRIVPDNNAKETDVPTTSGSCPTNGSEEDSNKAGSASQDKCMNAHSHSESVVASGSSHQALGEAG